VKELTVSSSSYISASTVHHIHLQLNKHPTHTTF